MDVESEIDPDIASAMGFSTFGSKPNPKKRKHLNSDDVGNPAVERSSNADTEASLASGSNKTPLQKQKQKQKQKQASSLPIHSSAPEEPPAPGSRPAPSAQTVHGAGNKKPSTATSASGGLAHALARMNQSTQEAGKTSTPSSSGDAAAPDLNALRRGVRNANGDIAYYMPSFVEDPWRNLKPVPAGQRGPP